LMKKVHITQIICNRITTIVYNMRKNKSSQPLLSQMR
jgi:hypothetical protein